MKESYQIGWGEQLAPAWPSEEDLPGFKKQCKEFMQAVHTLSEKLLLCFSEALSLGDTLAKEHDVTRDGVLAALRLLHYPDVTGQDFSSNYWRAGEVLQTLHNRVLIEVINLLRSLLHARTMSSNADMHALQAHLQPANQSQFFPCPSPCPCPSPPPALLPTPAAGAHTDFDTLTLLFQRQGQAGLEVCPGREVSTEFAEGEGACLLQSRCTAASTDRHSSCCARPGMVQHATRRHALRGHLCEQAAACGPHHMCAMAWIGPHCHRPAARTSYNHTSPHTDSLPACPALFFMQAMSGPPWSLSRMPSRSTSVTC